MDQALKLKVNEMSDNYKQLRRDYHWRNSGSINNLIALSYVLKGKKYYREDIDRINAYIRENTGPFSCYRQKAILFSALLFLNFPNPEDKFNLLLDYELRLKANGFRSYTYRPVTAYTLLLTCEPSRVDGRIAQAYEIFKEIRKKHPWLTSGDDYPLSFLLAQTGRPASVLVAEIEGLYRNLHEAGFTKSNGLQLLSHVLSLSRENNKEKAERCRRLYEYFAENKLKVYPANYGSLGLLTLLEDPTQNTAMEVKELSEYLAEDKNMRWLGKEIRFLNAASLVSFHKLENMKNKNGLIQANALTHTNAYITIEALIAAQNAAMLGAACAASAPSSGG